MLSGFLNQVWKDTRIDKISFLLGGIFLVRFQSKEFQAEAMSTGFLQFDNKPVIIKSWSCDVDLLRNVV